MRTEQITSSKQILFSAITLTFLLLIAPSLSAQKGYCANEKFRMGVELARTNSNIAGAENATISNDWSNEVNFLGEFMFFDKKLSLASGVGMQQSSVSLPYGTITEKSASAESPGVPDEMVQDDRAYVSIPLRAKWRSGAIGGNKKVYIGTGVNLSTLVSQSAYFTNEVDGRNLNQPKVVDLDVNNHGFDIYSSLGMEYLLDSSLILHAGVVYKKGVYSQYTSTNLSLNNLGLQIGVFF